MSKFTNNAIHLHGELFQSFKDALDGAELLKVAFFPKATIGWTFLLWLITGAVVGCMVVTGLKNSELAQTCAYLLMIPFFFVAEQALHHGVSVQFPLDALVSNLRQQPWGLRRAILRHAFFCAHLLKHSKSPEVEQLDFCLQFIEVNRSNRPPPWTAFFRHPIVVTTYGILIYTFNVYIGAGVANVEGSWNAARYATLAVIFCIFIYGLLYTFRYTGPNTQWDFERSLRWYRMLRAETAQDIKAQRFSNIQA